MIISVKIMRYASGDVEDLNRVKQQMTMEAITQGTEEHIIHHVMVNFMLNGEMRFMQSDFTRESEDTKMFSCLWRIIQIHSSSRHL